MKNIDKTDQLKSLLLWQTNEGFEDEVLFRYKCGNCRDKKAAYEQVESDYEAITGRRRYSCYDSWRTSLRRCKKRLKVPP
ncbi:MAG: hypothetical protein Q8928_02525 [Bacteroidota bacterium]|nr:hypothetical protein [Bacteroidota bacterium]